MTTTTYKFRLGPKLLAAIHTAAAAANLTPSEYVRSLIEKSTGVIEPLPRGVAGHSPRERKRHAQRALTARWAK